MFCGKCQNDLSECKCPDLNERLEKALGGGHLALKWCRRCDRIHSQCDCNAPDFYVRGPA